MRQNSNILFDPKDTCWGTEDAENSSQSNTNNQKTFADKDPVDILINMLDQEIIPRLLVSHKAKAPLEELASTGQRNIQDSEVELLLEIILHGNQEDCTNLIQKFAAKNISMDSIYLDLIPQTARKLGLMWEEDECSFTEVTIGLWRLQNALYGLSKDFQSQNNAPMANLNALLLPAPRSQHTLGLFIVVEFFRRAGWRVWGEPNLTPEEVNNLIFSQWFDVIGISIGFEEQLDGLNEMIASLRARSMNPHVTFMVGGPLFSTSPELFDNVEAEIKSADANDAIRRAEILVTDHRLRSLS